MRRKKQKLRKKQYPRKTIRRLQRIPILIPIHRNLLKSPNSTRISRFWIFRIACWTLKSRITKSKLPSNERLNLKMKSQERRLSLPLAMIPFSRIATRISVSIKMNRFTCSRKWIKSAMKCLRIEQEITIKCSKHSLLNKTRFYINSLISKDSRIKK